MYIYLRKQYIDKIVNILSDIKFKVQLYKKTGLTDTNKILEDTYKRILNIVSDLNLTNLNIIKFNHPAVDLGDKVKRIAYQVTSDNTSDKIKKTIKKFIEKKLYNEYDQLFFMLLQDKKAYRKDFLTSGYFVFDKDKHIIDNSNIIELCNNLDTEKLKKLVNFLELEFSSHPRQSSQFLSIELEHHASVDHSRDLIHNYRFQEALEFLEKLKIRIWEIATDRIKFLIMTLIANSKLNMDKQAEAGQLYIDAFQYDPKNEIAQSNLALGYLIFGSEEKAKESAEKIIKKNPNSISGYSALIQATKNEDMENLIKRIPTHLKSNSHIAIIIGDCYFKAKNYDEAIKWFKLAFSKDKSLDIKIDYTAFLVQYLLFKNPFIFEITLTEKELETCNEIIELTSDVLSIEHIPKRYKAVCFTNRSIVKLILKKKEEAIGDINNAIDIEPDNPMITWHYAKIIRDTGDIDKAIEVLKSIENNPKIPDASLLLAETYYIKKDYEEAINKISECIKKCTDSFRNYQSKRLLKIIYLEKKAFSDAKSISDQMLTEFPQDISTLVDASRISRSLNNKEASQSYCEIALALANENSNYIEKRELANEFYLSGEYEKAALLYEKITDAKIYNFLTARLLACYDNSGEKDKKLRILKNLGELKDMFPIAMLGEIYEEIGDLESALKVCNDALKKYPNNFSLNLRIAIIYWRRNESKKLDTLLKSFCYSDIPDEHTGMQLAFLYADSKLYIQAIKILYEIRRKYFTSPDIHLTYISTFIKTQYEMASIYKRDSISNETAILIRHSNKEEEWIILDDREDIIEKKNEKNSKNIIFEELINKKINDQITISEKNIATIISIESKYVFAFNETLQNFEKWFPETPGIWKYDTDTTAFNKEEIIKLLNRFDRQDKKRHVIELLKKNEITIGAFSKLNGKSIYEVWRILTICNDIGIRCCVGTRKERDYTLALLEKKPKIILDILSVFTLNMLNQFKNLNQFFGKFGIAQSTIDTIKNIHYELEGSKGMGYFSLSQNGNDLVMLKYSEEDIKNDLAFLKGCLKWIEQYCEVLPVYPALKVDKELKKQIEETCGQIFLDSMLLAGEEGNILCSEDWSLRSISKELFNVDGTWTQLLLFHCLQKKLIIEDDYHKLTLKLAELYYFHTTINAAVLFEALVQSNYDFTSFPYNAIIEHVRGTRCNIPSKIIVFTEFMYKLFTETSFLKGFPLTNLIFNFLDVMTFGENRRKVIEGLKLKIQTTFRFLPLEENELFQIIHAWQKTKLF